MQKDSLRLHASPVRASESNSASACLGLQRDKEYQTVQVCDHQRFRLPEAQAAKRRVVGCQSVVMSRSLGGVPLQRRMHRRADTMALQDHSPKSSKCRLHKSQLGLLTRRACQTPRVKVMPSVLESCYLEILADHVYCRPW